MNQNEFFNFSPRQPVNSVLAGVLIVAVCLWIVVYYFYQGTNMLEAHVNGAKELASMLVSD